jgi:hypothetical protein
VPESPALGSGVPVVLTGPLVPSPLPVVIVAWPSVVGSVVRVGSLRIPAVVPPPSPRPLSPHAVSSASGRRMGSARDGMSMTGTRADLRGQFKSRGQPLTPPAVSPATR